MENQEHSPGAEIPAASPSDAPKAKKRPAKVGPEVFLANWRSVLASEKDPVTRLRPMIRAGFQGEVKGEQVSQLLASLLERPVLTERLALPLAAQERFGKLKPLAGAVLGEVRNAFEKAIGYDPQEFSGYRAPRAVEDWVAEHAPKAPATERDSWFRRFVVCLLKESEPKTLLTGLVAASRVWISAKGQKRSNEEAAFVRGIVLALGTPAIGLSKLELILAGVAAIDAQFRQMLDRELNLERQIRSQQDSIEALRNQVSGLGGELAEVRTEAEKKAARVAELEQSLAEAGERYNLLDRHWRGVSEQQLAKQSGSFREKVRHEVQEALLALDREGPNVEMALERLRRIEEIVER